MRRIQLTRRAEGGEKMDEKVLNGAGLTYYDGKIKAWVTAQIPAANQPISEDDIDELFDTSGTGGT
jgi:hypothetical protein